MSTRALLSESRKLREYREVLVILWHRKYGLEKAAMHSYFVEPGSGGLTLVLCLRRAEDRVTILKANFSPDRSSKCFC